MYKKKDKVHVYVVKKLFKIILNCYIKNHNEHISTCIIINYKVLKDAYIVLGCVVVACYRLLYQV